MIKKIYPTSKKSTFKAENIYLKPLLSKIKSPYKPYYYANFLSSFDGRIAIFNKKHSTLLTPEAIKSDIDFSLFCQLHAQADCLVTNTKYMSGLKIIILTFLNCHGNIYINVRIACNQV